MHRSANVFARLFQAHQRDERRACPRSSPSGLTICHLVLPGEIDPLEATVNDISVRGMSLTCDRAIPAGLVLEAVLFNGSSTFAVTVSFKVLRCQTLPSGRFLVGGQLTQPLPYEHVIPFLL